MVTLPRGTTEDLPVLTTFLIIFRSHLFCHLVLFGTLVIHRGTMSLLSMFYTHYRKLWWYATISSSVISNCILYNMSYYNERHLFGVYNVLLGAKKKRKPNWARDEFMVWTWKSELIKSTFIAVYINCWFTLSYTDRNCTNSSIFPSMCHSMCQPTTISFHILNMSANIIWTSLIFFSLVNFQCFRRYQDTNW